MGMRCRHVVLNCAFCRSDFKAENRPNRVQKFCSNACKAEGAKARTAAILASDQFQGAAERYITSGISIIEAARSIGIGAKKFKEGLKLIGINSLSKGRPGKPKLHPKHIVVCRNCKKEFRCSPSSKRQFCSYKCHLENGGAQKAGAAAVMARLKYGAKKDANHDEIFDTLRAYVPVRDLSKFGGGLPDGIAWICGGWHLFDVKNPKTSYGRKGLNPLQKTWATSWQGGPVYLIYTNEEAEAFAKGKFDKIKKFPDDTITAADYNQLMSKK